LLDVDGRATGSSDNHWGEFLDNVDDLLYVESGQRLRRIRLLRYPLDPQRGQHARRDLGERAQLHLRWLRLHRRYDVRHNGFERFGELDEVLGAVRERREVRSRDRRVDGDVELRQLNLRD
jgi:hypothetical protein